MPKPVITKAVKKRYYRNRQFREKMTLKKKTVWWNGVWENKYGQYIGRHRPMYKGIRPYLQGHILDLGIGVTDMYVEGQDITGLDMSTECMRIMRQRHPWGNWVLGDAADTKLPSASFDTVVLANILEHYKDFTPLIYEAKRLIKPDGTIVIVLSLENYDVDHVYPKWDEEMIRTKVTSHFQRAEIELYDERWWIIRGYNKNYEDKLQTKNSN